LSSDFTGVSVELVATRDGTAQDAEAGRPLDLQRDHVILDPRDAPNEATGGRHIVALLQLGQHLLVFFRLLDCGRMTRRYMTPKISSMGISMPPSAPPGDDEPEDDAWANETKY